MLRMSRSSERGPRLSGFGRNIYYTGLTSFLTDTSVKMVYSVMPVFLLSMGATKTAIALIEGIAESTASLVKVISGFWSDRIGRNKPFMLAGYGLSALVMPLYTFTVKPFQVLVLRFIERFGKGIRTAPRDSLIAGSVLNRDTGRSFGFQKAMDNSGAIVGPLAAFGLLTLFPGNYRLIFILAGIPSLIGILVIIFGIKEAGKAEENLLRRFRFRDLPKRYYFFLIIIFVFTLGNSADALLLVRANDMGVTVAAVPLVFLVMNLVSVLAAVPAGSMADRIGKEKVITAGFIIYALVYAGFGLVRNAFMVPLMFALYGLYSAATDGIQKALIADLAGRDNKGTAMGIYNAIIGITLLPANLIAGIMYDKINPGAPFLLGAVTALCAVALMIFFILSDIAETGYKEHKL
jgi:MFS family permease